MVSFSDDFNRADSTNLGANWVEVSGDWSIISNQLAPDTAGGNTILRAATPMATADHYAQITIAATTPASQGVWCRGDATLSSGYLWRNDGSSWDLFAVSGGSFTVIGTYAVPVAAGDVAKVQAVGSTIKGYVNGAERVSVVNATASGVNVGLRMMSSPGLRLDNFAAADVTTGTTTALTPAISTESARPLAGTKTATPATAAEADTGQTLTGGKTAVVAAATEQAAAQAFTGIKAAAPPSVDSIEFAQYVTGTKTAVLPTAIETEGGTALTGTKAGDLAAAGSVETAQALITAHVLALAAAVETAQPMKGVKTAILTPAVEICTARPITRPSTYRPSPERTITVPAENRRVVVAAEDHTLTVR